MALAKDRHYWIQLRLALTAGQWSSPTPAKTPKGIALSWSELFRKFNKHVKGCRNLQLTLCDVHQHVPMLDCRHEWGRSSCPWRTRNNKTTGHLPHDTAKASVAIGPAEKYCELCRDCCNNALYIVSGHISVLFVSTRAIVQSRIGAID
jgi:hypothetical protein